MHLEYLVCLFYRLEGNMVSNKVVMMKFVPKSEVEVW